MSHSHNPPSRPYRDAPSVGVVVLNYNHSELTINCVNSLLKQEYSNFKIVVVDNNSPDETQKVILQTSLPEDIVLILNPENKGYAAGNNVGAKYCIKICDSDFVFVLNNDTILEDPKTIEKLVKSFEENINIVAVSPLVDDAIGDTAIKTSMEWTIQVRRLLNMYKMVICNVIILSKLPFFKKIIRNYLYMNLMPYEEKLYVVDTINGSSFMIQNSVLKTINYFNEKTFLYSEELILGCQIKALGKTCGLNCCIVVKHFQGLSTGNNRNNINWKMHKYHIDSFVVLLKDYYKAPRWLIAFFKNLRFLDFIFKKMYLWIMNIFG